MINSILSLVELLDLERLENNIYRGQSRDLGGKSVYGGQAVAQALVAAQRSIPSSKPRTAHSLHAYFLRPGDMNAPLIYHVERTRDGLSFTTRHVNAIQHGRVIFTMIASFQAPELGYEHQSQMPEVPPPSELTEQRELRKQWLEELGEVPPKLEQRYLRELPIEIRPIDIRNPFNPEPGPARQRVWFRSHGKLPDDALTHQCALAYASDFNLLTTAMFPHPASFMQRHMQVTSLDHAIWFHRPCRTDDWLLYDMDSPSATAGRGLSRGLIYNREGELVATVSQESLMRNTEFGKA